MIISVVVMAVILALTYIIKRKWQAITGFVLDVLILGITIPDVIDLFNTPETADGMESLGYAIGLSMFGPMIIMLMLAMIAIGIAQAFTIKKYGKKQNNNSPLV